MRRRAILTGGAIVFASGLLMMPNGRGPAIEQMLVAETEAAASTDAMCTMPDGPEAYAQAPQDALARLKTSVDLSGDIAPVRMVMDPYPSYNGIYVDTMTHEVIMSDTNRKSLLVYPSAVASRGANDVAQPTQQIMGPLTGIGFIAGVVKDPVHHELFAVNNDVEDRMVVFDDTAKGNVDPKRLLYVPHQSWGIAYDAKHDTIALSVQTPNMYVVFNRTAQKFDAPLRSVKGPHTGMADPHGIAYDATHNEYVVANHGNYRPAQLITSYTAYDSAVSRQEKSGNAFDENARGRFLGSSLTIYDGDAKGDATPLRTISGPLTQLDWPMGVAVDEKNGEIIVANNGNNAVLVFKRTANGNAQPIRVIRGAATGINGPMGVSLAGDDIYVANFDAHTALVFPRTAAGNVAPRRIIRNAPAATPTSGFGNPYAVAYDTKRQEILVPN